MHKLNKKMMRIVAIILVIALVITGIAMVAPSFAATSGDLEDAKKKEEQKREELEEGKKKEAELKTQIEDLEKTIVESQREINKMQGELNTVKEKVRELQAYVEKAQKEVDSQNSDLNSRLRVMYMSGDQSILQVLLGSTSIADFMNNIEMVKAIHKSDVDLLNELQRTLDEIEQKKREQESQQIKLESIKTTLTDKKSQLESNKDKLREAMSQQQYENQHDQEALARLEEESKRIADELANIDNGGSYTGGRMSWPMDMNRAVVTSEFGSRWGRNHNGIDIGPIPAGTPAPIYAAADGTVYSAGWNSGGYGNLVMITHNGGVTTFYAHNSSILVSPGQNITRGQKIALAGTTGNSTGVHCHFEVRVNGVPQNPRLWL